MNDYSYQGPYSSGVLGVDHFLWRVGLRDRGLIAQIQTAVLLTIGGWLTWLAIRPSRFPRAALVAMIGLYSSIFLYHRAYDTVTLAIPLTFALDRVRRTTGSRRMAMGFVALGIALVINLPNKVMTILTLKLQGNGLAYRLGQAVVLPFMTWFILVAILVLWWACRPETSRQRDAAAA